MGKDGVEGKVYGALSDLTLPADILRQAIAPPRNARNSYPGGKVTRRLARRRMNRPMQSQTVGMRVFFEER